jgi:hypothetical protein
MNIDDLKDAWNNDETEGMHLAVSTAMLGKTNSAVERLRKNMKAEFIATLISYLVILVFMFGRPQITFLFNISCILFFTILILNCFYFSRFYIFYKSINHYDFSIRESIRKIAYNLELNLEVYKTYNLSVAPIAVLVATTLTCGPKTANFIQHILASGAYISMGNMLLIFLVILFSFAITYVCFNWHVRLQFGKYLADIKQVMDDLGEEG